MRYRKAILFGLGAAATLTLAACGSGQDKPSVNDSANAAAVTTTITIPGDRQTVTENFTVTQMLPTTETVVSSTIAATGQPVVLQVGQVAKSGGIVLTVKSFKASTSYTVEYNDEGPEVSPRHGGKFIVVATQLTNKTKASIDLTCGHPVDAKLADAAEDNFDPIDVLYKIKGNPGCNDLLQPGFDASMMWVFEVPASATISDFGFRQIDISGVTTYPFALIQAPRELR